MKKVFVPSEGALNHCCVCLDPITPSTPSAVIVDCSHQFCIEDIHSWLTRHTSCPLCKIEILTVEEYPEGRDGEVRLRNIEEICSTETRTHNRRKDADTEPANLDCLDHFYFSSELRKVSEMRVRLEADLFLKHGSKGEPIEWVALQTMKTRLAEINLLIQRLLPFNPNELMVEMTGFVELLHDIKSGKLASSNIEDEQKIEDDDDYGFFGAGVCPFADITMKRKGGGGSKKKRKKKVKVI